jgi:ABC-2 type transport system ATP-binding protein
MQPVITTTQLSRRFGATLAVENLTLEVCAGEVFGFLGHNGAGKTTTVRLLNGLLAPSSGAVRLFGLDPLTAGPAVRRRTGVVTETHSIDERLTARALLQIYADLYGVPRRQVRQRVDELLALFGLDARGEDRISAFSKGMKQRLALARALLHEPEILFLDEPSSGLDPVAIRQLHDLIVRLSHEQSRTVFLCTHNLTEAQKLCDRVAVMQQGRMLALGTPAELARQVRQSRQLVIETDASAVPVAAAVLRTLDFVGEVQPNRERITVAGVEHSAIPALVSALVGAGTPIYQVSYQEPALEEFYFALHDRHETQREAQ